MLKILFVAEGNEGDEAEYDGLPVWENYSLIPTMKFKWAPFLDCLGLTIRDVMKKTFVEDEEDGTRGQPITKIGNSWKPNTDEAWCSIVTGHHKYQGEWQTDVDVWMPYEDEEPEPEPEPARPTRARGTPGRAKASADGQKATGSKRRKAEAEAEEPEDENEGDLEEEIEEDELEEEAASEKPARRAGTRRTAAATSMGRGGARAAKPAARGRGRKQAGDLTDDEVPF
jgi:hypothetical protein